MKRYRVMTMLVLMLAGALLAVVPAARAADTKAELKARMAQRLPQLNALKARGVVSENDAGLLTAAGTATDADKAVVETENKDRRAVYAAIAAKNGTAVATVAQQRAAQIAEKSAPGTMLQGRDGTWTAKK